MKGLSGVVCSELTLKSGHTCGFFHLLACPLASTQVMSMQRRICCLLPRWSHGTLPGKTSISGCCSSEARSCARWEWCCAHCYAPPATRPRRPASGKGGLSPAYSLPVVLGSGTLSPLAPFFCRLLEPSLIIYTLQNGAKIQNSAALTETSSLFPPAFIFSSERLSHSCTSCNQKNNTYNFIWSHASASEKMLSMYDISKRDRYSKQIEVFDFVLIQAIFKSFV